MGFQKRKRNWKRVQATSLREAFRLCKDYARETKNLSVERIAELMGVTEDSLYKWLANASMPAHLIPTYEHICGCHFATDYLALSNNRLVIEIPTGKAADARSMMELQGDLTRAAATLIEFYEGKAHLDDADAKVLLAIRGLAFHHDNIHKIEQPELELA